MYGTQRKYGFFTTYDETMFFKQGPHPKNNRKWVLWHSPVIRHNARSREISGNEKELGNPALYRGYVSLRECFLYFVHLAYQDGSAENPMEYGRWIGPSSAVPKEDYLSDGSSSESGNDEEEKGHGSKPRLGQQQASGTGRESRRTAGEQSIADLTARTSQLNIDSRSHSQNPHSHPHPQSAPSPIRHLQDARHPQVQPQSQPQAQPPSRRQDAQHRSYPWADRVLEVHLSKTTRRHYFPVNGGRQYVDLFEEHTLTGKVTYCIYSGRRYQVVEVKN